MSRKIKYFILSVTIILSACSNELKFEKSNAILHPLQGGNNYVFYLISNYNDNKYTKIEELVVLEFNRLIHTIDSLEYLQFDFYKKNWNTSVFLNSWDPYGSNSLMLPENDKKYGKYYIEGIYYERIENSNKWIYHAMKKDITDTIEVNH